QKMDQNLLQKIETYCDIHMGKSIVNAKDEPGFIANRIGTFWLHAAVTKAYEQKIDIEIADAVLGPPAGIPKTGIFGLLDLVGLDLMPHILSSLETNLKENDAFHKLGKAPDLLQKMIADGYTGRKGKGGFYRLNTEGDKKTKEVIDLHSGAYAPAKRPKPEAAKIFSKKGLRGTLDHDSQAGRYARSVLLATLAYAASLVEEIADTAEEIDRAMRLGYNWKFGPFELIDQLGADWFVAALNKEGISVPHYLIELGHDKIYETTNGQLYQFTHDGHKPVNRPEGVLLLQDVKRRSRPIIKNISASLWDIGDGIACLEFTSKMNSLNPLILNMVERSLHIVEKDNFKALVLHNEGRNFSVGANIGLLLYGAKFRLWPAIRWMVRRGQETFQAMQQAPFPVIGAPSGMALGGGCEILLHCDALTTHSETYMGLIETGVGIVPGWGGCKELLCRWASDEKLPKGPMPKVMKAFETIALAQVAKSAVEARDFKFLRDHDKIIMNQDRVLAAAKEHALALARNYTPPEKHALYLPGATGQTALDLGVRDFISKGVASPHDGTVAHELARVLSGGETDHLHPLTEQDILQLEVAAIDKLIRLPKTQARVDHMLTRGKPLRN
ncbi:MAG: 3-hydroxyacyl-CoA dehydrogenase family protein, partial [Alphaproteobacteria bacterium]|nr:3-hydroxyacyl-CoA dehydrogenase family protein [Alphaproteobacteria bacterium]